ncbi:hypothetical protein F9B85_04265 [Heliorestis acidaminivorans]|uniref:rRNA small subunit methyltransferase F RNA-binding PUA-like domain-containing protein n=2 Tax=Heliorestis acidaminivorans TaxID=553427 RepID=A0A6I0ETJ4_9FIRM|nr:hypothetical protein F9B85_04265 [Heliorestis acidaminivorans]
MVRTKEKKGKKTGKTKEKKEEKEAIKASERATAEALTFFDEFCIATLGYTVPVEATLLGEQLYGWPQEKVEKVLSSKESICREEVHQKDHALPAHAHDHEDLKSLQKRLEGIKFLRLGWHLGTIKRDRFEPAHAFALSLTAEGCQKKINFSSQSEEIYRYLKGESLLIDANQQGWHLVTVDNYPLGWGKAVQGQLKNHYPKGLRWL